MNRMPGFNAEQSLNGLHHNYAERAISSPAIMNSIAAQRLIGKAPSGTQTCIPGCVCVGPYECECCTPAETFGRGPRRPRWPWL